MRCTNGCSEACCCFERASLPLLNAHIHNPLPTRLKHGLKEVQLANSKETKDGPDSLPEVAEVIVSAIKEVDAGIRGFSTAMRALFVLLKQLILALEEQNRAIKTLCAAMDYIWARASRVQFSTS